jgi:transposase
MKSISPERLVFVDEAGYRLGSISRYGWAKRNERVLGYQTHGSWTTLTMLGAMALDGLRGFLLIESGTSAAVFRAYVTQVLGPNLREGDLVIMDNLAAHKDRQVREEIRKRGAEVLFLPPYSPDYNPIEKLWSKVKNFLRRHHPESFDTACDTLEAAMNTISPSDLRGWTKSCGYQTP